MPLTVLSYPIVTKTSTYTVTVSDQVILANGTFSLYLYAADNNVGHTLLVRNIGTGAITVVANGTEYIETVSTYVLSAGCTVALVCDGTRWWTETNNIIELTANNSTYAFGKAEGALNVNNSTYVFGKSEGELNVNNSTYAYGKSESALDVDSAWTANFALTANNSTYAFGKSEGALNVNNASTADFALTANVGSVDTANNSTHAFGKTEGALNVNSALGANNSTYAFGKSEGALNVNSALGANNSTYAFGKSEGALNVNSAGSASSAQYANSSTYLGSHSEAQLNVNSASHLTSAATTYICKLYLGTNANTGTLHDGGTYQVPIDTVEADPQGMANTSARYIKIPTGANGWYHVIGAITFDSTENWADGYHAVFLRKNGTIVTESSRATEIPVRTGVFPEVMQAAGLIHCDDADTLDLAFTQPQEVGNTDVLSFHTAGTRYTYLHAIKVA